MYNDVEMEKLTAEEALYYLNQVFKYDLVNVSKDVAEYLVEFHDCYIHHIYKKNYIVKYNFRKQQ